MCTYLGKKSEIFFIKRSARNIPTIPGLYHKKKLKFSKAFLVEYPIDSNCQV